MRRQLEMMTMLAVLGLTACALAQIEDGEPQLAEYIADAPSVSPGLSSTPRTPALDSAFYAMYDLDFERAKSEISAFIAQQPQDPLGPAAQAACILFSIFDRQKILQSEFFASNEGYAERRPIAPDPSVLRDFESALSRTEHLAQAPLASHPDDENALFGLTLAYGLRADYAALVERRDLAALRYSNSGNMWARKLLTSSPEFYDAYVAIGLQQYLVALRPAPLRWMLRLGGIRGSQVEALADLELAARKGRYLAPFARILLAIADLRKGQEVDALKRLRELQAQFPHNPLFDQEAIRLTQLDREHRAEKTTPSLQLQEGATE